jgi:hypothetical protein
MAILHAVAVWRLTTYFKDSELRELTCQDSCVFLFLFRRRADLGICHGFGYMEWREFLRCRARVERDR